MPPVLLDAAAELQFASLEARGWLLVARKIPASKEAGYKKGEVRSHSLKRPGWTTAAGFRRAMPTTPRTVISVSAVRGIKIRSVGP